uniref:Uncharacterized protein n=1 Tax=viral metagenome TaxID=1070528 RepID=A0A6M3M3C3_9ZZZZ
MAKYQQFLSRIGSNRDRAALRGIFSQFLTDGDPPALKDLVLASIILSGAETTQITISGACTTGILISSAATADGISLTGANVDGIHISGANTANGVNISGANVTGILISGANTADGISLTGANVDAIHISGANTATAIHISGDQVIGILYDVTAAATDGLKVAVPTLITLTSGITLNGAGTFTTGITLSATAITTGIAISAGSVTDGILISGTTPVDGIHISSACSAAAINLTGANASAIIISGANTVAGISISGDQVLGILFATTAAADAAFRVTIPTGITLGAGIDINATSTGTVTSGLTMQGTGTFTTGITLSATAITTGITISAGSITDGILISGTTPVDGIHISSACSAIAVNIAGANATSIAISGANTSTAVLISGTWGSSANYGAITLAGDAAGTALALGASATSLIGVRIDLTAAVTAGNDFMAIHSELETSGAMVDGFIIGTYQRVRVAHVAYENYAIWGRMDVNVAQTGNTGNQYLGVFGAVNFAAGAHALLATGGGYGVLGTAGIATGGTIDQPLIGGYFEANAVDTQGATLVTASRHRMLGYCNYGADVLCQTSNGIAGIRINTTDSAVLNAGILIEATSGSITNAIKFNAADTAHAVVAGGAGSATVAAGAWLQIRVDVAGTPYYFPVCSSVWTNV